MKMLVKMLKKMFNSKFFYMSNVLDAFILCTKYTSAHECKHIRHLRIHTYICGQCGEINY